MIALNKLSRHGSFPMFIFKLPMVFDVACGWSSAEEKSVFFGEYRFQREIYVLHYRFYAFVKSATATEAIQYAYLSRFLKFI